MTHTSICTNVWRRLLAWNSRRSSFYAVVIKICYLCTIYSVYTDGIL